MTEGEVRKSTNLRDVVNGRPLTHFSLVVTFCRKRRKQTHVPTESKDDKYWARRMKNNEAAKRSRDMRIKREKVVFEENSRLESDNRDMRSELVSHKC